MSDTAVANDPVLQLSSVSRRFGDRLALDAVDLSVAPGEFVALLGPNGSGKSTLLSIAAGVDTDYEGRAERNATRGSTGVVFQSLGLDPLLTVGENLAVAAALYGTKPKAAAEAAERCGIADRLNDRVGTLSGGLARRADLARALTGVPTLLLLDEPTTGLDPDARGRFMDLLSAQLDTAVLLSTHLFEEAERADRVVMLSAGRAVADAPPTELAASVGRLVVKVDATAAEHIAGPAFRPLPAGDSLRAAATDDESAAADVAARCASAGAACQIGKPTLADVYAARTSEGAVA